MKCFDTQQTAVVVDRKMYYGCCAECIKQLAEDPKSRVAVDPVSKKEEDKADAVVGLDKAGNIHFSESQRNLKKFRVPASVPPVPTGSP
jgi:YHS domain-containing protein